MHSINKDPVVKSEVIKVKQGRGILSYWGASHSDSWTLPFALAAAERPRIALKLQENPLYSSATQTPFPAHSAAEVRQTHGVLIRAHLRFQESSDVWS